MKLSLQKFFGYYQSTTSVYVQQTSHLPSQEFERESYWREGTQPSAHGRSGRDGHRSAPTPHQPLGSAASWARVPRQPNVTGDQKFRFSAA